MENNKNIKNFNSYEITKHSNEYQDGLVEFDYENNFVFETNNIIVIDNINFNKFYVKNKKSSKIYAICKKDISTIMFNTKKILSNVIFEKFIENNFDIKKTILSIKNKY